MFGSDLQRVVRMHAGCREDERIRIRQANCGLEIRRTVTGADRKHVFDSGGARALDDRFAVGVKLAVIQMAMRIDQVHGSC